MTTNSTDIKNENRKYYEQLQANILMYMDKYNVKDKSL